MTDDLWPGREAEARRLGIELIEDGIFRGLPRNGFGVIHIDPPWHFRAGINARHPSTKYKTMTMREIRALPIRELAAPDCALFLWSSGVWLDQSISVGKGWGFRFTSRAFLWVKLKRRARDQLWLQDDAYIATGHTTRKQTEDCLLFKRGKPKRQSKAVREMILATRREHSRKPDHTFDRIKALYPGAYLDIFGRESRPGWTVWGNEATKFDCSLDPALAPARGDHLDAGETESVATFGRNP